MRFTLSPDCEPVKARGFADSQTLPLEDLESSTEYGAPVLLQHILLHETARSRDPFLSLLRDVMTSCVPSALALALLEQASAAGYRVALMESEDDGPDLDPEERILYLPDGGLDITSLQRSPYFRQAFTLSFLRGLRAIDQAENGIRPQTLRPDQKLIYSRLCAADAWAVTLLVTWGLKESYPALWRHVLGSGAGDMAQAFLNDMDVARRSGSIDHVRAGLNAALLAWFQDPQRLNTHDHDVLDELDDRLQSGVNPQLLQAKITPDMIAALTELEGFRTGYLHDKALLLLKTPQCQSMKDPINLAHLQAIMRELNVVTINNVSFRDKALAQRIFPGEG